MDDISDKLRFRIFLASSLSRLSGVNGGPTKHAISSVRIALGVFMDGEKLGLARFAILRELAVAAGSVRYQRHQSD